MRINLLISDDLGSKIDKRAKELGITRTALISSSVARQLEQDDFIKIKNKQLEKLQNR